MQKAAGVLPLHRVVLPLGSAPPGTERLYIGSGGRAVSRTELEVGQGATASLDTYVNGIPLGYWRTWGALRRLEFRAQVRGEATVVLCACSAEGAGREVARRSTPAGLTDVVLDVELQDDDSWGWLEVRAGAGGARVRDAGWWAAGGDLPSVGVAITTHNRPDDCAAALKALASEPSSVRRIVVVDQGDRELRSASGFGDVERALGERLTVVRQANLGGSGGFARGMRELLADPAVAHVVFLDDDVVVEPEAIRRLSAFAAVAPEPVVVGGQMLVLTEPTVLHTTGEVVEPWRFWWRAAPGAVGDLDLASAPASRLEPLHRLTEVDFNGWWMCLIPRPVAERLGLPLPLFIKWDDVEYGLRAREQGVRVVTLPGAGLWHMPWTAKDTSRDWQAFYLARNRLVAAALHGTRGPAGLLLHLAAQTLGHVVSMAYSAADLTQAGVEEFLLGPSRLPATQRAGLSVPNRVRAVHVDARSDAAEDAALGPLREAPEAAPPSGRAAAAVTLGRAVVRALVGPGSAPPPEATVRLPLSRARWSVLYRYDRVLVAGPEGRPSSLRVRDRPLARRLLLRTARNGVRTLVSWPRLRRAYRAELPSLVAPAAWDALFDQERAGTP